MRLMLIILGVLVALSGAEEAKNATEATKSGRTGKELRDKRTLNKFGNFDDLTPAFFTYPRVLERRIGVPPDGRSFHPSPQERKYEENFNVPFNYQPHYESEGSNFIGSHYPHPQYLEAPEPIIEIIIKDSNETLPVPQPLVHPRKKKKEQVQVFYVKYKKDGHKGVIIDQPVAALSPTTYHQERHDEVEEEQHEEPLIVTLPPPLKTTTLRTVIHPDSEKFHSNSGIHVSFNTEDKSQSGHQFQEQRVESVVKPVVALPRSVSFPPQQPNVQATEFRQRFVHQGRNFGGDQFNYPQSNLHQGLVSPNLQLPLPNTPTQQFRSGQNFHQQSQYYAGHHRYSFQPHVHPEHRHQEHHPQQNQHYQEHHPQQNQHYPEHHPQHHQEPQRHTGPPPPGPHFSPTPPGFGPPPPFRPVPNSHFSQRPPSQPTFFQPPPPQHQASHSPPQQQVRFPGPPPQAPPSQNHQYQPLKYRPHPPQQRPIPIPIHQFSQPPQTQSQFRPPHQSPPHVSHQPQQQLHQNHQNHQPQQHHQPPQLQQPQHHQHHLPPQQPPHLSNQQFSFTPPPPGAIQGGGLVQQQAPNLSREPNVQNNQLNQGFQQNPHNQEIIQNLGPGSELIPSVAKYEQHIVEHVPQVNQYISSQQHFPVQQQFFSQPSLPVQKETQQTQQNHQRPNIGPLANEIGHLSTPQPSVTPQPQVYHQSTQAPAQTYIQQQISQLLQDPPRQNSYHLNPQPQIIPNSHPTVQKNHPAPGQSVSTLHSEVFPIFEQQQQRFYNKQPVSDQGQDQLQTVSINGRNSGNGGNPGSSTVSTSSTYQPTTQRTSETTQRTQQVSSTTQKMPKKPPSNVILPDEVPDDLREQLLNSGILDNADISVLDYDKIGDTALENLPPEHLANFFNAGGQSQISSSNRVEVFANPDKEKRSKLDEATPALSSKENVDLRVVRFDAASQKSISDKYIKQDSTVLPSVDITDHQYNRYLPLKINGAHFPIPQELTGKKISSVVVLAPVDSLQTVEENPEDGRFERDVIDTKLVRFLAGDALKQLIKKPSQENFKKWLDKEATTDVEFQSVVLLVTRNPQNTTDKEIFMYDIPSRTVNRLSGELSSAFVNVAEANAATEDIDKATVVDSGIIQQMDSEGRPEEDTTEEPTTLTPDTEDPMESAASDMVESRAEPDVILDDFADTHDVVISSGYSVIKS